jgi:hypothetical protein
MKIRYNLVLMIICIASFMLLASCDRLFGVGIAGAHKKHTIDIEVNDATKKLDITTKPIGKCKAANKKAGCFVVPHNETATVTFKLHGSGGWHFTEFKVCAGINKPGAGPDGCKLKPWQEREFAASLKTGSAKSRPGSDGIINLVPFSKTLRKFKLYDYNGDPQDYFYSIKACKDIKNPEDSEDKEVCYSTDPAIENKGRN